MFLLWRIFFIIQQNNTNNSNEIEHTTTWTNQLTEDSYTANNMMQNNLNLIDMKNEVVDEEMSTEMSTIVTTRYT